MRAEQATSPPDDSGYPDPTPWVDGTFGPTEGGMHILFVPAPPKPKTLVWWVLNRYDRAHLGWIAWFSRWRKYGFYPKDGTVYEENCLRDIAAFCQRKTAGAQPGEE